VINNLISNGKTALCDVPVDAVFDEEKPVYNDRPFYQLAIKNEFMMSDFQEAIKDI
jgi:hypothetical protein